jgi:hypothetical protein
MKRSDIDTGIAGRTAPYSDAVMLDDRHRWLVTSGTAGFDGGELADDFPHRPNARGATPSPHSNRAA